MKSRAHANVRIPLWSAAAAALAIAAPWYAVAQQSDAPTAEPAAAAAPAPAAVAALSPAEQLTLADQKLSKMKTSAQSIRSQLERVRREGDTVKSVCLDDKLSQANVAVRSAQDRRASLASAAERGDAEAAANYSMMLQVLAERSDGILAEAAQCVGAEKDNLPQDDSLVRVDDGVSNTELGGTPVALIDSPHLIDPPQCASCWR